VTGSATGALPGWLGQATHRAWLDEHCRDLLAFGQLFPAEGGGAAWLDDEGDPDPSRGVQCWITARMAHVYALGHLMGVPGAGPLADEALAGLLPGGVLHDAEHGGWYAAVDADGTPDGTKACYAHAFVVLAASTATAAGRPGAAELFARALAVYEERFWDEEAGMPVDTWDASFTELDGYRGINGAMHSTEALLAAADVLADVVGDAAAAAVWRGRALGIFARVAGWARGNGWRVPEHFDSSWTADLEYNADKKADPFKPYGATIGHGLEWARLMLHAEAAAHAAGEEAPAGLLEAAEALFAAAVADGWDVDGTPGFVYTTDWSGTPWCATACTGCRPRRRPSPRPSPCAPRAVRVGSPSGPRATRRSTRCGGTTSPTWSSTTRTGRGTTSSTRRTGPSAPSGRARPTCTTRCRPPSCRACRWSPRSRRRCAGDCSADPGLAPV